MLSVPARQRLLALGLVGLAVYVGTAFNVASDITAFMPTGGDPLVHKLTKRMADSELSKTSVLMVGGPDTATVVAASHQFERALRQDRAVAAELAFLDGGPSASTERAVYELYHPRRLSFVGSTEVERRSRLGKEGIAEAARELKRRLAQPMSPLVSRLAPSDPLLVVAQLFERLQDSQGRAVSVADGRFVTADGGWAVLFLTTRSGAFDTFAQGPVVAGIQQAFDQVNRDFGGKLRLEQSATNRIAVATERVIRDDIQRVTTLSIISLVLILWTLFRSLRLVLIATLPLGCGVLAGIASCLLLFGHVHGITLAFGASLIGVAIDYVVHLYCHHCVAPTVGGPRGTLKTISPALRTGAATTLVGFAALALAGFPGLQEVSLFASTGILAALITTQTFLPELLPATPPAVGARSQLTGLLQSGQAALARRPAVAFFSVALAIAVVALGGPHVHIDDNLLALGQIKGPLVEQERRVRDRVARFDQTRFVVALGKDEETALQANESVALALLQAQRQGDLKTYRNIASLLPSAKAQRDSDRAARALLGDGNELLSQFEQHGFVRSAFAPFVDHLAKAPVPPLTYANLLQSPLSSAVRSFRFSVDGQVAFVTFLHDVRNVASVAALLANVPGAVFVDQRTQMQQTYRAYQQRTIWLIGIGLLGVAAVLLARYRSPRLLFAAFAPALLAAAVTVSGLALAGYGINLVSLTALLMVVSMGVDYGVFLVDAEADGHSHAALLSIVIAAASTIFGFGLLAISQHPMLASIGITACLGILSSVILAPAAMVISGANKGTGPR